MSGRGAVGENQMDVAATINRDNRKDPAIRSAGSTRIGIRYYPRRTAVNRVRELDYVRTRVRNVSCVEISIVRIDNKVALHIDCIQRSRCRDLDQDRKCFTAISRL